MTRRRGRYAAGVASAFACLSLGLAAQQTARDATFVPTAGAASVSGIVVTDDERPRPVARAIVTLSGAGLRPSRGVVSDSEGRFTLRGLPAGRFTLSAAKASFITSAYGAKRPGRPGTTIVVGDGQEIGDLQLRLWRGAAVSGVLRDEFGRPIVEAVVTAIPERTRSRQATHTLTNNGVRTNDLGEYRIFGLEPGTYAIAAQPRTSGLGQIGARSDAEVDALLEGLRRRSARAAGPAPQARTGDVRAFDYAPTYYPGTALIMQATRVTLAPGQDATGLDFAIQRVFTATVEGAVLGPDGRGVEGVGVQLTPTGPAEAFGVRAGRALNATTRADGRFLIGAVPPGDYRAFARASEKQMGAREPPPTATVVSLTNMGALFWAFEDVTIAGANVPDLDLRLRPAVTVSGRVVFDGKTTPAPKDPTTLQVVVNAVSATRGAGFIGGVIQANLVAPAAVRADGTFELQNVMPDSYRVFVNGAGVNGTAWWLRSAMVDGRDALDHLLDVRAADAITGVELTFSDRHSEIAGRLEQPDGSPMSDVFVIAFPVDRDLWGPESRRVRAVRPGVDGRYSIKDLPPGEYLLGAVTDVDDDQWKDPAFLARLAPASVRLPLAEGETITQDLRMGG
jgi:hypothetical protein